MNESFFTIPTQKINLSKLAIEGLTLDIGGGGEGIIGQIKRDKIVIIDQLKEELEESYANGLKIIMDAQDLKFLDKTFDISTLFFTMMYIPKQLHKKVFYEIFRILKDGGELFLWDVRIPERKHSKENAFVVPISIRLDNNKIIDTMYGVKWDKTQNLEYFISLAKKTNFNII